MIHEMRERILFQKSSSEKDKNGNRVLNWTDFYSCAAYANNLSKEEYWAAAQTKSQTDMYFKVRYCSELKDLDSEKFRIIFRGEIYNITFIDNIQYGNKMLKIRVSRGYKSGRRD